MKYTIIALVIILSQIVILQTIKAGELEDGLFEAAEDGNLSGVNHLIAWGAYVDARGNGGYTTLMYAARYGHIGKQNTKNPGHQGKGLRI